LNSATVDNPVLKEATRYVEDQAYTALLGYKQPARAAEIIGAIGKEQYTAKLFRYILSSSSRFAIIDRKWDLEVRYEDRERPLERVLREIIAEYGMPMLIEQMGNELSSIFERPAEYYVAMLPRILSDEQKFFKITQRCYGFRPWLMEVTSDEEEDIIFDNDINASELQALEGTAGKVDWTAEKLVIAVVSFATKVGKPVDNKIVSLFRWRAIGEAYDPVETFAQLFASHQLVWMSDGRWATKEMTDRYDALLVEMAGELAEEIIEEATPSAIEKAEVAEDIAPTMTLTISENDLEEVFQIVSAGGQAKMSTILESIFEVSPRDPIYAIAAEGLGDAMRADARFAWVGNERWRMADTVPAHIHEIPTSLSLTKLNFETPEGESLEIELEDEGLEGGLDAEIKNPLVQDIGDQEPVTEQDELPAMESIRCVVTRHHKLLGTFPLCQVPRTFFPLGPKIIEVTLVEGEKHGDIWINQETGLIYDMAQWYEVAMPESGAVFELVKTAKSDEFNFVNKTDTDPLVFVSQSRIEELLKLAEEPRVAEMTTFELMSELLQSHRKGVPFVTLFTEVNLVRRSTRRLIASILSSYYPFYQRPKSALWQFDEKKADQGFKKAKRKYIRKEK
jgi:hypothetical protein